MNMENKHLHDYINNLVENDSFIQWVHSDFEDNNEEWSVFIDENMDQMVEINQAIKLISSLQFKENNTIDSKSLWSRINNSISSNSSTIDNKKPRIISLRYKWAVAAAACIGLFYFFMPLIQTSTTISSGIAQQSIETLPDGSIVRLDASSSITYKPKKWLKEREVKLSGVAFFEVKKGSKFVVFTDKGQVEVLGTSFNINARDEKFEVICKTGKVAVSNNGNSSKVTLNPGQKSFLKYNQLTLLSEIGRAHV